LKVTEDDRYFYLRAMNFLVERVEVAHEFVRYNGMSSLPMEQLTDLIIVGIKEWLGTDSGQRWMSLLGYSKEIKIFDPNMVCVSGSMSTIPASVCPSCSGSFYSSHGTYCESCGSYVCDPCISIVDPIYKVGWCPDCVEKSSLTNLVIYND
jgi:hypothetical protein